MSVSPWVARNLCNEQFPQPRTNAAPDAERAMMAEQANAHYSVSYVAAVALQSEDWDSVAQAILVSCDVCGCIDCSPRMHDQF